MLTHITAAVLILGHAMTPGTGAMPFATSPPDLVTVDYTDLPASEQRRLEYYVDKIADVIGKVEAHEKAGADDAVSREMLNALALIERFQSAAARSGLDPREADLAFQLMFFDSYSGRLPAFMWTTQGFVGLSAMTQSVASDPDVAQQGGSDYVRSMRTTGADTFSD